ncbi:MAG: hypothetical protein ACREBV_09730, partial [Candidatus Zixiibacteriota bacterium]
KNLYNEYADLFAHAELVEDLQYRRYYFALKAWQEPPYSKADSVYILNHLARISLERNDSVSSINYLMLATTIDTQNVYGHMLLLNYYNQFERLDEVLKGARIIASRFPDNLQALSALGLVYCQLDSLKRAESIYARAFQLDSSRFDVNFNYGAVLYQLGETKLGLEKLRLADRIKPNDFLTNYYLTSAHLQAGQFDSARYHYEQAAVLAKSQNERQLAGQLHSLLLNETGSKGKAGTTAP